MDAIFGDFTGEVGGPTAWDYSGVPRDEEGQTPVGSTPDYAEFAETMRQDLAPNSLIERIAVERAIVWAWQLHTAGGPEAADSDDVLRAEQGLCMALELVLKVRALVPALRELDESAAVLAPSRLFLDDEPADDLGAVSNEWPIVPRGRSVVADDDDGAAELDPHEPERWQDRLVFDPNVSDRSPVVRGTWITVNQVVSQIVDGWSWADILRTHPELTEEQLRMCLAYTVAHDHDDELLD